MRDVKLKTSHIVVSADLEDKVMAVVNVAREAATRRERGSCKVQDRTECLVDDQEAHQLPGSPAAGTIPRYEVKRTFIHVPIPSSMRSSLSAKPATL
eukprot:UN0521